MRTAIVILDNCEQYSDHSIAFVRADDVWLARIDEWRDDWTVVAVVDWREVDWREPSEITCLSEWVRYHPPHARLCRGLEWILTHQPRTTALCLSDAERAIRRRETSEIMHEAGPHCDCAAGRLRRELNLEVF